MTITPKQKETWDLLLKQNRIPIAGKNLNQQAHTVCEIFAEEEVSLSLSCAKRLIKDAKKHGQLVEDDQLRTLSEKEREALAAKKKESDRAAASASNRRPVYVNNSRAGVAA